MPDLQRVWIFNVFVIEECNLAKEVDKLNKPMPKFLLMENVTSIRSKRHIDNFEEWQEILNSWDYHNVIYDLHAEDFNIPQSRKRTFMISIYHGGDEKNLEYIKEYLMKNNLETIFKREDNSEKCNGKNQLKDILKLDYTIEKYRKEALQTVPNYTYSRKSIEKLNPVIVNKIGDIDRCRVRTITTKQDRHPNSGIIYHDFEFTEKENKAPYRYLTPRECFILMGFDESDYQVLVDNNYPINAKQKIFTVEKLTKMAGNSIVVNILEKVFMQIMDLNEILNKNT